MFDAKDYLSRFKSMVDQLQTRKDVTVSKFEIRPPATKDNVDSAKRYLEEHQYPGSFLSDDILAFYRAANGFKLEWTFTGPLERLHQGTSEKMDVSSGSVYGSIDICPIQKVFDNEMALTCDYGDDHRYRPLHCLDAFIPEACAAFYFESSKKSPGDTTINTNSSSNANNLMVYYHFWGESLGRMELDFVGYLEKLLKAKGFGYWQRAIAADEEKSFNPQNPISSEERRFRHVMPILFQDDYNDKDFLRVDRCRLKHLSIKDYPTNAHDKDPPAFIPRKYEDGPITLESHQRKKAALQVLAASRRRHQQSSSSDDDDDDDDDDDEGKDTPPWKRKKQV
ncbi:expressed unknown protein [Seminavis robusta]|uniref:Uncharacterized protein n=1 Tax=Seminavis robusta TaxID=568900 RepID=A0A9N8E8Z6_9STRA|nr:expressed unknown protein [Seminavis robusta]|eukprot:Sro680_g186240.1 n/a (338) ;mRNA; f:29902-30915